MATIEATLKWENGKWEMGNCENVKWGNINATQLVLNVEANRMLQRLSFP